MANTIERTKAAKNNTSHCNTTNHAATNCHTLQHTATLHSILHHAVSHCITLHHAASHCNTLHHTATYCIALPDTTTPCTTLQHTTKHFQILQQHATPCNTTQHTATHRIDDVGFMIAEKPKQFAHVNPLLRLYIHYTYIHMNTYNIYTCINDICTHIYMCAYIYTHTDRVSFTHVCMYTSDTSVYYRVPETHRMPYLYTSFSAKEPYNWWLFFKTWPAT